MPITPTPGKPKVAKEQTSKPKIAKNIIVTVLPVKKPTNAATAKTRAKEVVERLKKSTKPAKLSTLRSTIKACFKPVLDEKAVDAVMQSLQDSKTVLITGSKVTYALG